MSTLLLSPRRKYLNKNLRRSSLQTILASKSRPGFKVPYPSLETDRFLQSALVNSQKNTQALQQLEMYPLYPSPLQVANTSLALCGMMLQLLRPENMSQQCYGKAFLTGWISREVLCQYRWSQIRPCHRLHKPADGWKPETGRRMFVVRRILANFAVWILTYFECMAWHSWHGFLFDAVSSYKGSHAMQVHFFWRCGSSTHRVSGSAT